MFTLYPSMSDAECTAYLELCREVGIKRLFLVEPLFNRFVRLKNSEWRFPSSKKRVEVVGMELFCSGIRISKCQERKDCL